jgi:hypothetical protein
MPPSDAGRITPTGADGSRPGESAGSDDPRMGIVRKRARSPTVIDFLREGGGQGLGLCSGSAGDLIAKETRELPSLYKGDTSCLIPGHRRTRRRDRPGTVSVEVRGCCKRIVSYASPGDLAEPGQGGTTAPLQQPVVSGTSRRDPRRIGPELRGGGTLGRKCPRRGVPDEAFRTSGDPSQL